MRGRRAGRKQEGLGITTTPTSEGWKAIVKLCVVHCFNFSSCIKGEPNLLIGRKVNDVYNM